MALKATFDADFQSFLSACSKAELSLKSIDSGAAKVGTSLSRMADSLSGTKLIQQASLMSEAVDRVGGVSTLTAKELQRVGAQASEAAAKLTAMGKDVPPGIQKIADAAQAAASKTKSFSEQLQASIPTAQSLTTQVQAMALGYVTGTAAIAAFEKAGRLAYDFVVGSIQAYTQSEDAQRRLVTALTSQGQATQPVIDLYGKLAEQYQRTTVNSDELIKETESLLVQVGGVLPTQMNAALKATTDLSSGLGIDLRSATMLVSKAFEDNFSALKKAGVQIDETRAQAEGMDYVLGQVEKRFGGQAQSEVESYAGQIKRLANEFDDLKEKIGELFIESGLLQNGFVVARVAIQAANLALLETKIQLYALASVTPGLGGIAKALGVSLAEDAARSKKSIADLESQIHNVVTTTETFRVKGVIPLTSAQKAAATEAARHADAVKRLQSEMARDESLRRFTDDLEAFARAAEAQTFRHMLPELEAANDKAKALAQSLIDLHNVQLAIAEYVAKPVPTGPAGTDSQGNLIPNVTNEQRVLTIDPKPLKAAEQHVGESLSHIATMFTQMATISEGSLGKVVSSIGSTISAVSGMQGAMKAFNQEGGHSLSNYTAIAGGMVGIGIAAYQAGKAIHDAMRDGRNALVDYANTFDSTILDQKSGFDELHDKLAKLGPEGEALWAKVSKVPAGDKDAATRLIAEIQKAFQEADAAAQKAMKDADDAAKQLADDLSAVTETLDRYGATWMDLPADKIADGLSEALGKLTKDHERLLEGGLTNERATHLQANAYNGLIAQAFKAGVTIPPALLKIARQLVENKELTDENARAFLGLASTALPNWQAMSEAAGRYNIEETKLGKGFDQAQLNDKVKQVKADWDTLIDGGTEINTVMLGMQPAMQGFIDKALKSGVEIPASMKDILAKMTDAGLLTDENGVKLEDLSKINFGQDMADSADILLGRLATMEEMFTTTLPDAATDGARKIAAAFASIHFPSSVPGQDTSGPPVFPQASGGDYLVTKPTLFLAGEAGAERATFTPRGASRSSGGGETHWQPIVVNMDGIAFMQLVAKKIKQLRLDR